MWKLLVARGHGPVTAERGVQSVDELGPPLACINTILHATLHTP